MDTQLFYEAAFANGVAYERECCAKLCELCLPNPTDGYRLAHIIRARSASPGGAHSDSIAIGIKRGWDLAHKTCDFPSAEEVCRILHQEIIAEMFSHVTKRTP